jgi:hypothetical protein
MRSLALSTLVGLALAGAGIAEIDMAGASTTRSLYVAGPAAPSGVVVLALSSDVRIDQAKGRIPAGKLPELGNPKKNGSSSAAAEGNRPLTCDSSNATSQGCYTATQQARPLAK